MIEEVTRYQTKDGHLHISEEQATEHIVTVLENNIGRIIDTTGMGIRDRLNVVDALVGTPEKAKELMRILATML